MIASGFLIATCVDSAGAYRVCRISDRPLQDDSGSTLINRSDNKRTQESIRYRDNFVKNYQKRDTAIFCVAIAILSEWQLGEIEPEPRVAAIRPGFTCTSTPASTLGTRAQVDIPSFCQAPLRRRYIFNSKGLRRLLLSIPASWMTRSTGIDRPGFLNLCSLTARSRRSGRRQTSGNAGSSSAEIARFPRPCLMPT